MFAFNQTSFLGTFSKVGNFFNNWGTFSKSEKQYKKVETEVRLIKFKSWELFQKLFKKLPTCDVGI